MVLEGLRGLAVGNAPAQGPQYVRAMGAGGAGGKGLAWVEDCMTCLDVGEYEALARERSRLALRASTMRASQMRRDAQADTDLVVAESAALALAANASAKAKIAGLRGLSDAQRLGYIGRLAAASARIMSSTREDWIGRGTGYSRLAGLGLEFSTTIMPMMTGTVVPAPAPAPMSWADQLAANQRAVDEAIASVGTMGPDGKQIRSIALENYSLNPADKATWDGQVSGWVAGPWFAGQSKPYIAMADAVRKGTVPFKVDATREYRYNGPARTLIVSVNEKSWIADKLEAAYDFVEGMVTDAVCIAARQVSDAAMSRAGCGMPPFESKECKAAAMVQAGVLRAAGCSVPAKYEPPSLKTPEPETESGSGTAIAAVGAGALLLMLLAG